MDVHTITAHLYIKTRAYNSLMRYVG